MERTKSGADYSKKPAIQDQQDAYSMESFSSPNQIPPPMQPSRNAKPRIDQTILLAETSTKQQSHPVGFSKQHKNPNHASKERSKDRYDYRLPDSCCPLLPQTPAALLPFIVVIDDYDLRDTDNPIPRRSQSLIATTLDDTM